MCRIQAVHQPVFHIHVYPDLYRRTGKSSTIYPRKRAESQKAFASIIKSVIGSERSKAGQRDTVGKPGKSQRINSIYQLNPAESKRCGHPVTKVKGGCTGSDRGD